MNTKLKSLGLAIAIFLGLAGNLLAGPDGPSDFDYSAPTVPADVAAEGRQKVVSFLFGQIDSLYTWFDGRSLVGQGRQRWHHFTRDMLERNGYVNNGAFGQLKKAVSRIGSDVEVVALPGGGYDVTGQAYFYTKDDKTAFTGGSYFEFEEGKGGGLIGRSQVYINLARNVNVKVDGIVSEARWLGRNWNDQQSLTVDNDYDSGVGYVQIPTRLLEQGLVAISSETANGFETVLVIDLANNAVHRGAAAFLALSGVRSSEMESFKDPVSVDNSLVNAHFYRYDGQTYGRFPVIELDLTKAMNQATFFTVPVSGRVQGQTLAPNELLIEVIKTADDSIPPGTYTANWSDGAGGWTLNLPPGIYHLRFKFPGLLDWEADGNPKG